MPTTTSVRNKESHSPEPEIAHVLFMDIVGYSLLSGEQQAATLRDLHRAVRSTWEFSSAHRTGQVILLPTNEGMALVFFGDPEAAARCALEISAIIHQKTGTRLRMGLNTGPVYRTADLGSSGGVAGLGIHVAQRVMDFGQDGHILVSNSAAEFLSPIGNWNSMLHDVGEVELSPELRVHLFNLYDQRFGNAETPSRLKEIKAGERAGQTAKPVSCDPMIGNQVSHYRVLKKISDGGMGVVYEAQDLRLGRRVAIKFLPEGQYRNRAVSERFQQEARAASSLNHANICTVHDVGDFQGRHFIVMELLEGDVLKRVMSRQRLNSDKIMELGAQIADALDCAHSQGIIHRDIKPSNIFVTVRGQAKVLDFGLAKFVSIRRKNDSSDEGHADATEPHLTHPGEFMGTVSYMSPEQARGQDLDPRTDLFSFGVVLYEMATGKLPFRGDTVAVIFESIFNRAPVSPIRLNPELPAELDRIIGKTLEKDRDRRYQSAAELRIDLQRARMPSGAVQMSAEPPVAEVKPERQGEVVLLYKRKAQPDEELLAFLDGQLRASGYRVFIDRHLQVGVDWAREIEQRVSNAEAVVVLLSSASVGSEMLAYEVQVAHDAFQNKGKPRILPVRINLATPLPPVLAAYLDGIQHAQWQSASDNESVATEIAASLESPPRLFPREIKLETVGGAVPLDSQFYIARPTDQEFHKAIARGDSIVLIKGARQMGKTSLMARGLQEARKAGTKVVLTDFQKLNASQLESVEKLFLTLAETIAEQLEIDVLPDKVWNARRGPSLNFDRFLRREILGKLASPLVWGIDEVDRLFTCSFGSEVFGLFRAWHNERSLDPDGPWRKLTLAIAYATEAHMFITDMNQSPFNVGTRLVLTDFTFEQVVELNKRYGSPLKSASELEQFHGLVGGQPYLTRRGLHELATHHLEFAEFEKEAARDEGAFGDHLRRLLVSLAQEEALCNVVRGMLTGHPSSTTEAFYRLRSSGLVSGESARDMKPRCRLYELYLERHLL